MQWVLNGSRLGYRGMMNAVGTEWVTPGLPRMVWPRHSMVEGSKHL